jgi:hypothetical protein
MLLPGFCGCGYPHPATRRRSGSSVIVPPGELTLLARRTFLVSGAVGLAVTWLAQRLTRDRFDRVVGLSIPGGRARY